MQEMTSVIINKCDTLMKNGDFFQYPIEDPFILPIEYDGLDEENRNERFWVKMMEAGQPFDFSKE